MARTRQKDIFGKLADAGEEALSRVAGSQATARVLETVNGMRERVDELQKRIMGLDRLEKRVAKLEKTVAELQKPKTARSRSSSGTTARKRTTSGTSSRSTTRKKPSS
jgi:ubiquinone biosynthesis protein UbiJ